MTNCKDSRRAWIVAVGTFLLMFLENGAVKSLGVLLPSIREQFHTKTWVVGFAISLVSGFGAVMCLFSGAITKVLSPRTTITGCALIAAIGLVCTSFTTNVYVLMVSLILTGFSSGTTTVTFGALSKYFDKHYDVAITAASCGMSLGIITMPPLTQIFLDMYGWRGATLLLSGISLNAMICGLVFKPLNDDSHENPKGTTDKQTKWYSDIISMFDMHLFTNSYFVGLLVVSLGNGYSRTGWLIYVVPHALDAGFLPYRAAAIAAAGGFGNLVGNFIYPILYRILPNKPMLYITMLLSSVALVLDGVATSMSSYIWVLICSTAFMFMEGVMSSSWYIELNNAIDNDTQSIGAMGLGYTAFGVGSLITGVTSGWLFDVHGNYMVSFLVLGVVTAVTLIPMFISDVIKISKSVLRLPRLAAIETIV